MGIGGKEGKGSRVEKKKGRARNEESSMRLVQKYAENVKSRRGVDAE
jgi:hypothetical protein